MLEAIDNKKHFKKGDKIEFSITSNKDGFVQLISVGPDNTTTLLIPNKWHSGQIKANQPTVFPTDSGHEFYVAEPYGRTLIKAKVSNRPLPVDGIGESRFDSEEIVSLGNTKSIKLRSTRTPTFEESLATKEWGSARLTVFTKEN